jgi:hypothetical protein
LARSPLSDRLNDSDNEESMSFVSVSEGEDESTSEDGDEVRRVEVDGVDLDDYLDDESEEQEYMSAE